MTRIKILLGTLFGAGLLPGAPGTWGSLLTLPIIYGAYWLSPEFGLILLLMSTILLSLWTTDQNVSRFGEDPPQFVMDEAAGQTVVFMTSTFHFAATHDLLLLLAGFILFRVFDILKPFGIKKIDAIKDKYGILVDDLLAGFYALIILETTIYLICTLSS